jgi:hypothetical protein
MGILLALDLAAAGCTGWSTQACLSPVEPEDLDEPGPHAPYDDGADPGSRPSAEGARPGGADPDPDDGGQVAPCLSLSRPEPQVGPCLEPPLEPSVEPEDVEVGPCLKVAPAPKRRRSKTKRRPPRVGPCLNVLVDDPDDGAEIQPRWPEGSMGEGELRAPQRDALIDALADTLPADVVERLRARRR